MIKSNVFQAISSLCFIVPVAEATFVYNFNDIHYALHHLRFLLHLLTLTSGCQSTGFSHLPFLHLESKHLHYLWILLFSCSTILWWICFSGFHASFYERAITNQRCKYQTDSTVQRFFWFFSQLSQAVGSIFAVENFWFRKFWCLLRMITKQYIYNLWLRVNKVIKTINSHIFMSFSCGSGGLLLSCCCLCENHRYLH